jgi:hypothetical protein
MTAAAPSRQCVCGRGVGRRGGGWGGGRAFTLKATSPHPSSTQSRTPVLLCHHPPLSPAPARPRLKPPGESHGRVRAHPGLDGHVPEQRLPPRPARREAVLGRVGPRAVQLGVSGGPAEEEEGRGGGGRGRRGEPARRVRRRHRRRRPRRGRGPAQAHEGVGGGEGRPGRAREVVVRNHLPPHSRCRDKAGRGEGEGGRRDGRPAAPRSNEGRAVVGGRGRGSRGLGRGRG